MAFFTPPEVLLRPFVRALSNSGIQHNKPVIQSCTTQDTRCYRSAVCTTIGQPLKIQNAPLPDVPAGKVLVSTFAAGINFADLLITQGKYQIRPETPFVPGCELAGRVEKLGKEVEGFKKGDRVIALSWGMNAFADFCLVDPHMMFPIPEHIPFTVAAGTLCSYGTAMMALSRSACLKTGETVLVTAAAGATGLAAVDIALNVFGAEVIGVCGGEDKVALLKQRGVKHIIDYYTAKIPDRVKAITNGKGVNVVVDHVGGDIFMDCLKSTAFEGRIVTVGYASGHIPKLPINHLLLKSCSVHGVWWGDYSTRQHPAFDESIVNVMTALAQDRLHPYVGKIFPLEEINTAFDYILNRKSSGKVVVQMKEV
ncbi:quinone oxidoreductase-like protein 2 [Pomacea canaliculata]|uniref:quinone oxidoreductase-like protein 2 n=1 Tax=Pomacea canaliculata TaxID=400727 RepID=UPI000D72550D|nr:quinone oxidoreductase-like protein 2 [Pomacea canaliculata]